MGNEAEYLNETVGADYEFQRYITEKEMQLSKSSKKVRMAKMIKCTMEDSCEKGKLCCCCECEEKESCDGVCKNLDNVANCGYAEMDETSALAVFQSQQVTVLNSIAELIKAKKDLEAKEADLKVKLQDAMEAYGIKKFTSDILNITYVAATKAESIDSTKLKAKYPQIASECVKVSNRKAYIKVEVKGGKK